MKTLNKMKVLFKETQKFRQLWLWILLLSSSFVPIYLIYKDSRENSFSNDHLLTIIIFVSVILLLWFSTLETIITEKYIQVKYFPFVNKTFQLNDIKFMKVIDYGFVGGWGIRLWTKYGTVYNTSGSKGLHIKLPTGKSYVIGTKKPEELQRIINQLNT